MDRRRTIVLTLMGLATSAAVMMACADKRVEAPEAAPRTASEEQIITAFKERLSQYESLSRKLRGEVFPSNADEEPADIHKHQKELAARIVAALPEWRQGQLFAPDCADLIRTRLAGVLAGTDGANVRGAIFDEAPPAQKIVVMTEYPTGAPIATAPAQILKVLPVLPKELEYRFVGRDLILFDVSAYLMVDVIPNAIR